MFCLDNTDVLEAWSDTDAKVDCTIHGLVGTTFTNLYTGTLSDGANTVVYTAGAAISVVSCTFVNTHSSAVTVNFKLDPANGGNDKYLFPVITLGAGSAIQFDGQRCSVINDSGETITVISTADVAHGGTGLTTITDHGVMLGSGTDAVSVTDSGADGEVLVSNGSGADPDWEYVPKENLITNPFEVCSNSTLENYGSAIVDDDCADDDTGDWSTSGSASLVFDTDHYELSTNAGDEYMYRADVGVTIGHLYEFKAKFKDGTATPSDVYFFMNDGTAQSGPDINITGSFVEYSQVFEATATNAASSIAIFVGTSMSNNNFEIKDITFYEVTPGFVAADNLCFDGWYKDTTLDVYREPNGSNTKDGEYYGAKLTPSAADDFLLAFNQLNSLPEFYSKFAGRTVTFGMWVKTSTADHIFLQLRDSDTVFGDQSSDSSSFHTGGGSWEWLEVSSTISSSTTLFQPLIICDKSSGTAYISQPMLVFGSSIGEGNYSRPKGWVYWEDVSYLEGFAGDAFSDVGSATEINLEALSEGKIPKGIEAVLVRLGCADSDVSTGSPCFYLFSKGETATPALVVNLADNGADHDDKLRYDSGVVPCDSAGNIHYSCAASGSNTLDVYIAIIGVELR